MLLYHYKSSLARGHCRPCILVWEERGILNMGVFCAIGDGATASTCLASSLPLNDTLTLAWAIYSQWWKLLGIQKSRSASHQLCKVRLWCRQMWAQQSWGFSAKPRMPVLRWCLLSLYLTVISKMESPGFLFKRCTRQPAQNQYFVKWSRHSHKQLLIKKKWTRLLTPGQEATSRLLSPLCSWNASSF